MVQLFGDHLQFGNHLRACTAVNARLSSKKTVPLVRIFTDGKKVTSFKEIECDF